jgi:hypothetical protein
MIFSLDVRRARKGDCLLLHFGSKTKPGLALIDGGPKGVYGPHLKPRLVEVRQARKLDPQTRCTWTCSWSVTSTTTTSRGSWT